MIVKILNSSSSDFHGVKYNDKKIDKGTGELLEMKNFPSFINQDSKQEEVRNYLKSVSKNGKVKNPQFHAVISTKFDEHSKDELRNVAENFMEEMGYEKQPYIIVFHNDTENNHVHIVSTRVDKQSGKKINDSYEKLNAQRALSNVMEKLYQVNQNEKLEKLLKYQYSSLQQLKLLLERSDFKTKENLTDENKLDVLKNGVVIKTIQSNEIFFQNIKNEERRKQLKAIFFKYKEIYSNKVFRVDDNRKQEGILERIKEMVGEIKDAPTYEFESEFQKKARDVFGIDICFSHKNGDQPFGYTIIDHKTGSIFKGSEVLKMKELFEFTESKLDKRTFEILKDYNVPDENAKKVLLEFFRKKNEGVLDFMIFDNKNRKNKAIYNTIRSEVKEHVKQGNGNVSIIIDEEFNRYAIHERHHYIAPLKAILGEKEYQKYIEGDNVELSKNTEKLNKEGNNMLEEITKALLKGSYSGTGQTLTDDERKRKRKKRK